MRSNVLSTKHCTSPHKDEFLVGAGESVASALQFSHCYLNQDIEDIWVGHFVFSKLLDVKRCYFHVGCRWKKKEKERQEGGETLFIIIEHNSDMSEHAQTCAMLL